jgi:peptidyl-prolyl cis-trans isomerase-like 1
MSEEEETNLIGEKNEEEKTWKTIKVETSLGGFELELYYNEAPKTCYNFGELANQGYYNNTIFHRIVKDFMIQGIKKNKKKRRRSKWYWKRWDVNLRKRI